MSLNFTPLPPPNGGPGASIFDESVRAELRGRPSEWAIIARRPYTSLSSWLKRRYADSGYEFATRTVREGDATQYDTYARYVGEVTE